VLIRKMENPACDTFVTFVMDEKASCQIIYPYRRVPIEGLPKICPQQNNSRPLTSVLYLEGKSRRRKVSILAEVYSTFL